MLLNLNPVMSIIANVPAAIAETVRVSLSLSYSWGLHENYQKIVAGRVVRRLNNFTATGTELYPCVFLGSCTVSYWLYPRITTQSSTMAFRTGVSVFRPKASTNVMRDGVHVHVSRSYHIMKSYWPLLIRIDGNIRNSRLGLSHR
jgi:hypothetical protein